MPEIPEQMKPEDVPAELVDAVFGKREIGTAVWPHQIRAILAIGLPLYEARLRAERDALEAAIADVRRLCEMTIAASCRVQAIDQATDTLAVLDRALAVPESHGGAPTEGRA